MKTKVLLVDDDIPVHAALNGVLRREGYDVINAFDTDEAMVCLQPNLQRDRKTDTTCAAN